MSKEYEDRFNDEGAAPENYRRSLKKRLKKLEKQEKEAFNAVCKNTTTENISKLNSIRVDIQIVQSRLDNYGKDRNGFEEVYVGDIIK